MKKKYGSFSEFIQDYTPSVPELTNGILWGTFHMALIKKIISYRDFYLFVSNWRPVKCRYLGKDHFDITLRSGYVIVFAGSLLAIVDITDIAKPKISKVSTSFNYGENFRNIPVSAWQFIYQMYINNKK